MVSGPTNDVSRPSVSDFQIGDVVGEGSYSVVYSALHKSSAKPYAIKALNKAHIARHEEQKSVYSEKAALLKLAGKPDGHPGIIQLMATFQDTLNLYFVLELAPNGDLMTQLVRLGSLSTDCTRYYVAQLVDAVSWMHSRNVIHLDLKPENILLNERMNSKITDFGTAQILDAGPDEQKRLFVGTAEYCCPEMISDGTVSRLSDIWSIGCIIFILISGQSPFKAGSDYLIMKKVKDGQYSFPEGFDPEARDLIEKILVVQPSGRLGASDVQMTEIRLHPFFGQIDWSQVWNHSAPKLEPGLVDKMLVY